MRAAPLRGRDEPLARALAVLRGASRHGSTGAILVSGPAGIGKTTVLAEICRRAAAMQFQVASSKCDPIGPVWPGAPVVALLRASADPLASTDEYEKVAGLVTEPLLIADQIASLLEAAAMDGPLLIVIDDLQWADGTSRFILRMLFPRLIGLPVVWLLASRDADVADSGDVRAERIPLGPLDAEEIAAIAADRLGIPLDDRARRFLATADGNPLLAGQIIDSLTRPGARGDAAAVPPEFTAAIADRMAAMDGVSRDLVRLLAVAGRRLPMSDVTVGLPEAPGLSVERAMATVIESGLIVASSGALAFRHDLVLEAVYATTPADITRQLHLAFAQYYLTTAGEPVIAASHARKAIAPGDLGSAEVLAQAAETLASVSPDDAGELAALAIHSIGPTQPGWLELGLRCLAVLCRVQRSTEAVAVADLILAHADGANIVGQVETEAARALWLGGRLGELVVRADRILGHADLEAPITARLRAVRALARTRLTTGDAAAREAAAALQDARATGDRDALVLALQAAGMAASNEGRHEAALRNFRELRSATGRAGIAEEIMALQFLDRCDHAQTLLDQARADTRDASAAILPSLQHAQAWQYFLLGRLDDADASARALISLGRQLGNDLYTVDAITIRVSVSLLRGEAETAAAQLRWASDLGTADDRVRQYGLAAARGWLAAARGDLDQALTMLRPVVEGGGQSLSYWPLWPCWNGIFFEFAVLARDRRLARACIEVAQTAAARNPGVASYAGIALNLRGRQSRELALIASSAEMLTRSPRPLLRAYGADTYGRALLAAGQRSAALEHLDRAWDGYHHAGAWGWRAQAEQVMREAGARYPKWATATTRAASGWPSLTEAERRVAALIGTGHTNKSAASELGVSVNTIGVHLRAVFTKLGIQSRVQLANELHRQATS